MPSLEIKLTSFFVIYSTRTIMKKAGEDEITRGRKGWGLHLWFLAVICIYRNMYVYSTLPLILYIYYKGNKGVN